MRGLAFPERGGVSEARAIAVNNSRRLPSKPPPEETIQRAFALAKEAYPSGGIPKMFDGGLYFTDRDICRAANSVKLAASPGSPYFLLAESKGAFIDRYLADIIPIVRNRLRVLATTDPSDFSRKSAQDMVQGGLADLVKVFIKNEPHPLGKLAEGRARIIMVETIVHEIIQKMVFGQQMAAEKAAWDTIPSKPGMGLATDEQASMLFAGLPGDLEEASTSDISGYDWNQSVWMFKMTVRFHLMNNGVKEGTLYSNLCYNVLHVLANSVYLTSDGKMMVLEQPGVMNSGSNITSWFNSLLRALLAYLVGHTWVITMGDDAVHSWLEDAIAKYLELGIRVKSQDRCPGYVDFCSHHIYATHAIPTGIWKSCINLLQEPFDGEKLFEFVRLMKRSPLLSRALDVIKRSGYCASSLVDEVYNSVLSDLTW